MPRQHFTRVQHQYTTRVYTHGVMPRVLLCKLCACVTRVFCVCHACLLRVARVSSACRTRGLFKLWVICTVVDSFCIAILYCSFGNYKLI